MSDREPLSVSIVCMDAERTIRQVLEAVRWAEDIVVVDSFSRDRTVEICRAYTDRVIQREWPGYVAQKNYALSLCRYDWTLAVDSDEIVTPQLAESIRGALRHAKERQTDCVGFTLCRRTWYLGRWIRHGGWYPDRKLRLFRRSAGRWVGDDPHDRVEVEGPVGRLEGDLLHYSYADLEDHLRTVNRFTSVAARELDARGAQWPLLHMLVNAPFRAFRMFVLQRGFLDGVPGLISAVTAGYYVFLKYAKLWDLRRRRAPDATPEPFRMPPQDEAR